jgi:hypothetical protein
MPREFSHYHLTVTAGPGMVGVDTQITYYDLHGLEIGTYAEGTIAFATTWKDIARAIRKGLKGLGCDSDPVSNISPMVDLT